MKTMILVMHNICYRRSNRAVEALRAATKQCSPPDTKYHARKILGVLGVVKVKSSKISERKKASRSPMA